MKKSVLAAFLASSFLIGATVSAQVVQRVYDNGSVWTVGYYDVKPGQFNAYMKFLKEVVIPRMDFRKRAGDVLSYRVLSVANPRDTDPDVLVLTEYKNMAVFDRGPTYFDDMDREMAGSLEARQGQMVQLREMTEPRGSLMAREIRWLP